MMEVVLLIFCELISFSGKSKLELNLHSYISHLVYTVFKYSFIYFSVYNLDVHKMSEQEKILEQ